MDKSLKKNATICKPCTQAPRGAAELDELHWEGHREHCQLPSELAWGASLDEGLIVHTDSKRNRISEC